MTYLSTSKFNEIIRVAIRREGLDIKEAEQLSKSWGLLPIHKQTEAMYSEYVGHFMNPQSGLDYINSFSYGELRH